MKNYIISASQGGLSNRIKCLISSMKIADKTNRELLLYWPKDKHCNCNFKDLFENKIKEILKEDLRKIIKNKNYKIYENDLNSFKNKIKFIILDASGLIGFSKENIHLKFEKIPKNVQKQIIIYLNKLEIKKEILKKVSEFSKKFSKNIVGVHIRKGDFTWLKVGIGKVSSEEKFIEEMKKEIKNNSKISFFLSTENKETEKKFKKVFDKKIVTYPKKNYKREEENSVKEALIELLLLSKTKKIIGTFGSTFNELSWFLGDCKPEIQIVIDKNNFKEYLKNKKKQKNLINKTKKFLYELIVPRHERFFRVVVK